MANKRRGMMLPARPPNVPRVPIPPAAARDGLSFQSARVEKYSSPFSYFLPPIEKPSSAGGDDQPASSSRRRYPIHDDVSPFLLRVAKELCQEANEEGLLDASAWVRVMTALDLRPSACEESFRLFGGRDQGYVSVQYVLRELEMLLTREETKDIIARRCFAMFAFGKNKIEKNDLTSLRVARTERGGCTRSMISALIKMCRSVKRFPSDKRQFISYPEFRYFLTSSQRLGSELVAAFVPVFFTFLDEVSKGTFQ